MKPIVVTLTFKRLLLFGLPILAVFGVLFAYGASEHRRAEKERLAHTETQAELALALMPRVSVGGPMVDAGSLDNGGTYIIVRHAQS